MATYYVRPTNGSDAGGSYDGLSFDFAFASTQKALDTAVSGDEIRLCNESTETPSAKIDVDTNAGSQTNPILVRAGDSTDGSLLTSGHYVISGSALPTTPATNLLEFLIANNYIRFERIRFTAATDNNLFFSGSYAPRATFIHCRIDGATAAGARSENSGPKVSFVGCEFDTNGTWGATVNSAFGRGFGRWIGCSIHDNTEGGIDDGAYDLLALNCVSYDNGSTTSHHGFAFTSATSTLPLIALIGNVSFGNGGNGFDVPSGAAGFFQVLNNVSRSNSGYGFDMNGMELAQLFMDYNCSHNNTAGHIDINSGTLPGDNNLTVDPEFELETDGIEDFEPASGSPLIGAGFPGALPAGGTGYADIGALQREMAAGGGSKRATMLQIVG